MRFFVCVMSFDIWVGKLLFPTFGSVYFTCRNLYGTHDSNQNEVEFRAQCEISLVPHNSFSTLCLWFGSQVNRILSCVYSFDMEKISMTIRQISSVDGFPIDPFIFCSSSKWKSLSTTQSMGFGKSIFVFFPVEEKLSDFYRCFCYCEWESWMDIIDFTKATILFIGLAGLLFPLTKRIAIGN